MSAFVIACIGSSELLRFDADAGTITRRLSLRALGPFDVLHSVRQRTGEYLVSTTYGVHLVDAALQEVTRSWSHPRLSNVHAVDPLPGGRVLVSNTGYDELIEAELGPERSLVVHRVFDAAAWMGRPKKLPLEDRRGRPRVSARDDHLHLNCAYLGTHRGRPVAWCALFHTGSVIAVDLENFAVIDEIRDVGKHIHTSIPTAEGLMVCSSSESMVRRIDPMTHVRTGEWAVPDRTWVRSATPIGEDMVFCGERDRSEGVHSRGYVARMCRQTGAMVWRVDLDEEGPFDIIEALP